MPLDDYKGPKLSRRNALRAGFGVAVAAQLAMIEQTAFTPNRAAAATHHVRPSPKAASTNGASFPDIQFDIGNFISPPVTLNDGGGTLQASFGPVFTYFVPATFVRRPTFNDLQTFDYASNTIEDFFSFSPSGIFVFQGYGVPYFNLLPGGINGSLVQSFMPQLRSGKNPDGTTNVLAEAVPSPTDVVGGLVGGPGAPVPNKTKDRFNVNVTIEQNHMLWMLRSDSISNLNNVLAWMKGSNNLAGNSVQSPPFGGLLKFGTTRVQFVQRGLPAQMANSNNFEFAPRVNPDSPMWMGFLDQQVDSTGPAAITTFAGNNSARLTSAVPGDYFDNGAIAHFSHVIEDLYQFYSTPNQDSNRPDGEPFTERCQYMFRSNQLGTTNGIPAAGNTDQFTNGGGPAFVNNVFQGTNAATLGAQDSGGLFAPGNQTLNATFTGLGRVGHEAALQRVSRAADGTPIHIRMDGPGLDAMDVPAFRTFPGANGVNVPAGSNQFKLEFAMFVPTADFFAQMRIAAAAQDLQHQFLNDEDDDNGLERFITATRRQNFLVPPRRHRAFPLLELT